MSFNFLFLLFVSLNAVQELNVEAQPDVQVESTFLPAGSEESFPFINNNTQNESAIVSDIPPSSDNPKEISDSSDEILLSEENSGGVDTPQGLNSEPGERKPYSFKAIFAGVAGLAATCVFFWGLARYHNASIPNQARVPEGPSEDGVDSDEVVNRDIPVDHAGPNTNHKEIPQPNLRDEFFENFNTKWGRAANWEASVLAKAVDDLLKELGNATYLSKEYKQKIVDKCLWIIWGHPKFTRGCDTKITKPDRKQILQDHTDIKKALDKLITSATAGGFLPVFEATLPHSYYVRSKDSKIRTHIKNIAQSGCEKNLSEDVLAYLYAHRVKGRRELTMYSTPGSILREFRLACLNEDDFSNSIKVLIDNGLISAALIANGSNREYHITLGKIEDVAKIKKSDLKKVVQSLISRLNEPFFQYIDELKVDFSSKNVECGVFLKPNDLDAIASSSKLVCSLDVFCQILHYVTSIELCDDDKVKINFKDGVKDKDKEKFNNVFKSVKITDE